MTGAALVPLTHELAAALYLAAAGLGWSASRSGQGHRAVPWVLGLGFAIHALGMASFHRVSPPIPLNSVSASLSLIGWLFAGAYLASLALARVRGVGPQVGGAAGVFTVLADLGLRFAEHPVEPEVGSGAWPHAHVLLAASGFSLLALASLAGLAYLVKERALKAKRGGRFELPSLESLDRVEHLALVVGFPLLTLGVLTGFVWALRESETTWSGHAVFMLLAWSVYLLPMGRRLLRRERGRGPARGVVVGFVVLTVSYLGVRLFGAAV